MTKIDLGNTNNEKIEELNLIALRKYACAKVNNQKEWYLRCLECPSIEDCSCGKRVRDILETQTKPESQIEKFENRMEKTVDHRIEEALTRPYPAQWLVAQGYYSTLESAKSQIRKYNTRHGTFGTSPAATATIQRCRDMIEKIFGDTNDMDVIVDRFFRSSRPNSKVNSIFSTVYRWRRSYPDLVEKYPMISDLAQVLNNRKYTLFPGTVKEYLEEMEMNNKHEEDEVSIEDFLNETEEQTAVDYSSNPDGELVEIPKPAKETKDPILRAETTPAVKPFSDNQLVLQKEFGRKRLEIRKRLHYIQTQFESLDKERVELLCKLESLDKAAELFGMRPVTVEEKGVVA